MTNDQDRTADLGPICDEVGRMLFTYGHENSCIDGSVLLVKVLHLNGFSDAYPLSVGVSIFNEAYQKWVQEHGPPDAGAAARACVDTGGCKIDVGKGLKPIEERWGGHLAVVVPNYFGDRHALLDLTICQGDRPDFEIVIPPVQLDVSDDFIVGNCSCRMVINKCLVVYEAYPDDRSYGDWDRLMAREDFNEAAAEVVSKLA